MAVVLRYGAMSSLVSEQGAFDALCPFYRLASCCRVRKVRILISPPLNPELENVCLTLPFMPERCPQTGCKRGGVAGAVVRDGLRGGASGGNSVALGLGVAQGLSQELAGWLLLPSPFACTQRQCIGLELAS